MSNTFVAIKDYFLSKSNGGRNSLSDDDWEEFNRRLQQLSDRELCELFLTAGNPVMQQDMAFQVFQTIFWSKPNTATDELVTQLVDNKYIKECIQDNFGIQAGYIGIGITKSKQYQALSKLLKNEDLTPFLEPKDPALSSLGSLAVQLNDTRVNTSIVDYLNKKIEAGIEVNDESNGLDKSTTRLLSVVSQFATQNGTNPEVLMKVAEGFYDYGGENGKKVYDRLANVVIDKCTKDANISKNATLLDSLWRFAENDRTDKSIFLNNSPNLLWALYPPTYGNLIETLSDKGKEEDNFVKIRHGISLKLLRDSNNPLELIDTDGRTLLEIAIFNSDEDLLTDFVYRAKETLSEKDYQDFLNKTPAISYCLKYGDNKTIQTLINLGFDVNASVNGFSNAVSQAIQKGDIDIAKILIQNIGANPDNNSDINESVLHAMGFYSATDEPEIKLWAIDSLLYSTSLGKRTIEKNMVGWLRDIREHFEDKPKNYAKMSNDEFLREWGDFRIGRSENDVYTLTSMYSSEKSGFYKSYIDNFVNTDNPDGENLAHIVARHNDIINLVTVLFLDRISEGRMLLTRDKRGLNAVDVVTSMNNSDMLNCIYRSGKDYGSSLLLKKGVSDDTRLLFIAGASKECINQLSKKELERLKKAIFEYTPPKYSTKSINLNMDDKILFLSKLEGENVDKKLLLSLIDEKQYVPPKPTDELNLARANLSDAIDDILGLGASSSPSILDEDGDENLGLQPLHRRP